MIATATMSSLAVTFSSLQSAANAVRPTRQVPRESIPLIQAHVEQQTDSSFEAVDDHFRVVVMKAPEGRSIAEVVDEVRERFTKDLVKDKTEVQDSEQDAEQDTEDAEQDAEQDGEQDGDQATQDIVVWVLGGSEPLVRVELLQDNRLFVGVSGDTLEEAAIVNLLIGLFRSAVAPFLQHGTRNAWKNARRPRLEIVSDWEPSSGDFDISITRRAESLRDSTVRRLDAAYEAAFMRKVLGAAKAAAGRWAKKAGAPVPEAVGLPTRVAKKRAGPEPSGDTTMAE